MSKKQDILFLREMTTRLRDGLDRNDPAQLEFVDKMINDWIRELENKK